MPTIAEMELLNRSLDSLQGSLVRSSMLKRQREEDARRSKLDQEMMGLRREELGQRRSEADDQRAYREKHLGLAEQEAAASRSGKISARWKSAKGTDMQYSGDQDGFSKAVDANPPSLSTEMSITFTTPSGLAVNMTATPEQFQKAQADFPGLMSPAAPAAKPPSGSVTLDRDEAGKMALKGASFPADAAKIEELMRQQAGPASPQAPAVPLEVAKKLQQVNAEIIEHRMNMAVGDTRYSAANVLSRQKRLQELETEKQLLLKIAGEVTGQSQPTAAGPAGAGAGPPGQVLVEKDGKRYWLPEGELQEALKQGYSRAATP